MRISCNLFFVLLYALRLYRSCEISWRAFLFYFLEQFCVRFSVYQFIFFNCHEWLSYSIYFSQFYVCMKFSLWSVFKFIYLYKVDHWLSTEICINDPGFLKIKTNFYFSHYRVIFKLTSNICWMKLKFDKLILNGMNSLYMFICICNISWKLKGFSFSPYRFKNN